jgi:hypothetical protein
MRNLLALLGATVVTVVAVGWYLDWFRVRPAASGDGHKNYNLQLNTTKIEEDIHKGTSKALDAIEKKVHEHQAPSKGEKSTRGEAESPYLPTSQTKETETVPPGFPAPEEKGPELVLPEGPPSQTPPPPGPPQR